MNLCCWINYLNIETMIFTGSLTTYVVLCRILCHIFCNSSICCRIWSFVYICLYKQKDLPPAKNCWIKVSSSDLCLPPNRVRQVFSGRHRDDDRGTCIMQWITPLYSIFCCYYISKINHLSIYSLIFYQYMPIHLSNDQRRHHTHFFQSSNFVSYSPQSSLCWCLWHTEIDSKHFGNKRTRYICIKNGRMITVFLLNALKEAKEEELIRVL